MAGRLCRTPAECFAAGWNEPCDHGGDPDTCPECSLTATEIGKLVILLADLPQALTTERAAA